MLRAEQVGYSKISRARAVYTQEVIGGSLRGGGQTDILKGAGPLNPLSRSVKSHRGASMHNNTSNHINTLVLLAVVL